MNVPSRCPGCGLMGLHKMCPAWGTPVYMNPEHPAWGDHHAINIAKVEYLQKEVDAWRRRFPGVGFDGTDIVMSG
jgi:hypothetical protein